jgi:hypothetical protein
MTTVHDHSIPHLTLREENEQLSDFLLASQRFLMKHPQASREVISGFLEEGRRFAQTPEGKTWMEALAHSELVKRALMIWEAYGLDLLLETRPAVTPSTWLEMIVAAMANPDLESILSMLIVEEMRLGNVSAT